MTTLGVLKVIRERQSDRIAYDSKRPVARQDLRKILEAARWAPSPHNMQNFEIIIVDDKKLLKSIQESYQRPSGSFHEKYQRSGHDAYASSEEELLRKKYGIFVPTHEEAHPRRGRSNQLGPILGIVTYDPNKRPPHGRAVADFLNNIGLGCALENMWLMAQSLGLSFQVMSVLGGPSGEEVKGILDIPERLRIAFGFRLGYAVHMPMRSPICSRVRREMEDLTHHNRYGNKSFD
jgi:nitroreductase